MLALLCLLLSQTPADYIDSAQAEGVAAELGFESLFNGRDLSGWVVPEGDNGHWRVVDGVIDYDAGSEAVGDKNLRTERSFRDFVCEIEWRIKPGAPVAGTPIVLPDGSTLQGPDGNEIQVPRVRVDSGIYLRGDGKSQVNIWNWPVGSGEMYGLRTRAAAGEKQPFTPLLRADRPLGEWNRFTIVLVGRTLTVLLNDHTVLDRTELPESTPEEGPLVFQHHGGRNPDGSAKVGASLVQFRNIRIREL